ncbi:DUF1707 SHOCT-like domain-containing protein [Actinocorallia libanotica]|uniref:DUF1707 SHOCT-like domain-containing protein n=1 Tax=Actinocorallia libanotica TaxID=46162 RepID=UPI0031D4A64E
MDSERPVPVRDMRASDADRERVAELLHEAVTDGRLTLEEHAERIEAVYRARTLGELTAFTRDLLPAEQQPFKVDAQNLVALFGSQRREGRWVVPARLPVAALFGTVELDLRQAILQRRHITLDVSALCGRLRLIVPEGVEVRVTGRAVLSTARDGRRQDLPQEGPLVEVTGTLLLGSVKVVRPRRPWRASLRRGRRS